MRKPAGWRAGVLHGSDVDFQQQLDHSQHFNEDGHVGAPSV